MSHKNDFSAFYEPSPYQTLGSTYMDWAITWYEWVQSIKREDNPVIDSNGTKCSTKQKGRVWFLSGIAEG